MIEEIKHIRKELKEANEHKDWWMVNAMINRIDTIVYNHESEVKKLNLLDISGSLHLSKDEEIGLYEKYLDEFTGKDGRLMNCNPDAIFNWFAWQLWRVRQ